MDYKFELIEKDWFKRRSPDKPNPIIDFEVIGFEKTDNHMCMIKATYQNGEVKEYISRVIHSIPEPFFTDQRVKWIVDGMHVSVVIYEE